MDIIICTTNQGKLKEFKALMDHKDTPVKSLKDIFPETPDVIENGKTFVENAIKKVENLPATLGRIYISDDSGLEVHCLGGIPGVHSARYGGKNATDKDRCTKLLVDIEKKLIEKNKVISDPKNRTAHFSCAIALKYPSGKTETFEGFCYGHIATSAQGNNGFGYDPIFIPEGYQLTLAELSGPEKNKLSHRGAALLKMARRLQEFKKPEPKKSESKPSDK